ncbi:uncharacterized protein LOC106872190 [Octopus bimaculoides]|uniref:Receptor ligand binding region domain-containing protein n=1 Tax=Octopus bimaculoides TaxID=37653 RepID=A0A0L8H8X2_OCTBM|nr:uncharacterized protein LOC106872190 [Octopus bimaculoides]|eukprot:XP_014774575.1 PREDICTED: uncharacterized protein LOC106872190 [Octopus bimaculoides]
MALMRNAIVSAVLLYFLSYLSQALVLRCDKEVSNSTNELRIAVILSAMTKNLTTNQCSVFQDTTIPNVGAIQWIINKLNAPCSGIKLIPQYNIEFTIFDICGEPEIAANYVYDIYKSPYSQDGLCGEPSTKKGTPYTAIISLGDYSVTESLLETTKYISLPVISPLFEQMAFPSYKNFISFALPMETQVKAAIMLLKRLKWVSPGIVYSDNEYGIEMANMLEAKAKSDGICFSMKRAFSKNALDEIRFLRESFSSGIIYVGEIQNIDSFLHIKDMTWIILDISGKLQNELKNHSNMEGSYVVTSSSLNNKEFEDYLRDIKTLTHFKNDTLYQWVRNILDVTKISSKNIPHNGQRIIHTRAIMESVYGIALAKQKECKRLKCSTYLNPENLRSVLTDDQIVPDCFSRSALGLKENSMAAILNVYLVKKSIFQKVGEYFSNDSLQLESSAIKMNDNLSSFATLTSKYSKACPESLSFNDDNVVYVSGNILILGIFSLHDRGQGFGCGDVRKPFIDTIAGEAFLYYVNKFKTISDSVKLGALLLDDCYNPLRAHSNITSILSGETKIKDISTCQLISPSNIVGVVGSLSSSVTKAIANVFMLLKRPVISYAASSEDLDDRISYPYFLRTVPSDNQQVNAIIQILKHFDWRYVGLIYATNNYGLKAKQLLLSAAKENQICLFPFKGIADSKIKTKHDEFDEIFSVALIKNIKVIIYFGTSSRTVDLLESLNQRKMHNFFTFIGSDAWGKNNLILSYGHVFAGSIIITVDSSKRALLKEGISFKKYLKEKDASLNHLKNPYFKYFWNQYMCDPSKKASTCIKKTFSDNDIDLYVNNHRIVQTMNAVYAIHNGLKKLINEKCSGKMCEEFSSKAEELVLTIKETEILNSLDAVKMFDSHGNGLIGFQFHNVQYEDGKYTYKKIGSFSQESGLTIDKTRMKLYNHKREEISELKVECAENMDCCDNSTITKEPKLPFDHTGLIFAIGAFILVIILIVAGGAFISRMKNQCEQTKVKTLCGTSENAVSQC